MLCKIVSVVECASRRRRKAAMSGAAFVKLDNRNHNSLKTPLVQVPMWHQVSH